MSVYSIPKSSYIVFTEFQNIKGNVVTSKGKKFEILGSTNIVAIYFNSTGNISLYTEESSPQACKLVHYRDFSPNCTKIITISGPRTYIMDGKYGENSCLVTAFSLGYIQTIEFGAMNSSYYGADGIDQYTFFKIFFFSAQYTNFTPLYPNENVSLKYEIKTTNEDRSLKYTIEDDSDYKAYYLTEKSFKKLRTGEDNTDIEMSTIIWMSCMIVVVILCIVGVVVLYVFLRKRRPAHSRHEDKEEPTQPTTNGESSQEKYSEPLVDNADQV
ncbi:hypothetical protein TVAG_081690 [Trichomonas vaginalis G3]|uniref:Uncharacterized protein n=1 Tax=Trichomonas vaginalis (strain ATCC PRA-98 / G3) TaxID=412133 RepID=A2E6W1_TRIV3|nr:hypothetical protein TVAGG3_0493100 [Trichomonas vaginalis G3]EAY11597.1 hypothetical protein TVAG_081690 [Trichomonas vaginalis G3]KAI5516520.1 hypothetical protein TVAGG3_0493100 [Trichomonas vaginalis G3]|eukprot:XP_001323820.1 hypothetical protein [Trichomonas vaginalis G3]